MCFQPFNRLFHWGPFATLGIIKVIFGSTIYCSSLLWPRSSVGFINNAVLISALGILLYNYLSSSLIGPGYLPLNWKPENESNTKFLQYCNICQGYKAPRVHHCKICNRCVLKMDHHCPWINNCVGWENQVSFTTFLFFSIVCCLQSSIILLLALYHSLYSQWYLYHSIKNVPIIIFNIYGMSIIVFALGLSIGVVISVGTLLKYQVAGVLTNCTNIESWILKKAAHRRINTDEVFIFPYDLGYVKNIKQVVNWGFQPFGDGIHWPVKEGCHEFMLTIEQLQQKLEKRERMKKYRVIKNYSGSWFPTSHGIGTFCHPPCTDESRLNLQVGDLVSVSRWKLYWLYGAKNISDELNDNFVEKGWFPRNCVVQIIDKKQE